MQHFKLDIGCTNQIIGGAGQQQRLEREIVGKTSYAA